MYDIVWSFSIFYALAQAGRDINFVLDQGTHMGWYYDSNGEVQAHQMKLQDQQETW